MMTDFVGRDAQRGQRSREAADILDGMARILDATFTRPVRARAAEPGDARGRCSRTPRGCAPRRAARTRARDFPARDDDALARAHVRGAAAPTPVEVPVGRAGGAVAMLELPADRRHRRARARRGPRRAARALPPGPRVGRGRTRRRCSTATSRRPRPCSARTPAFAGRVVARRGGRRLRPAACSPRVYEMLADAAGSRAGRRLPARRRGRARSTPATAVAEVTRPRARRARGRARRARLPDGALGHRDRGARAGRTAAGARLAVCDTRKTCPGLRALSKYAVRVGGGTNHRDGPVGHGARQGQPHRGGRRSLARAVALAREAHPDLPLEVEADTLEQAAEACRAGADIVLLDNMDDADARRARSRPCARRGRARAPVPHRGVGRRDVRAAARRSRPRASTASRRAR